MKLNNNKDFFKRKLQREPQKNKQTQSAKPNNTSLNLQVRHIADTLIDLELPKPATYLLQMYREYLRERFSVAFVGEFSKGKSTLINKLLGQDLLPVDNLPTTALLTRLRYSDEPCLTHYNQEGEVVWQGAPCLEEIQKFTADNFGDSEAEGSLTVSITNEWLRHNNLEFIDTPGAGDLNEKRARRIGDALLSCDGAIITVSALQPLSETEHLFMEQRIISRKVPYTMLALTKLDCVKPDERAAVISYVKKKLKQWKYDIPVCVPYDVDIPEKTRAEIMGLPEMSQTLEAWVHDERRLALKGIWLKSRINEVLDAAIQAKEETYELLQADEARRLELINDKLQELDVEAMAWDSLCLDLEKRENVCYNQFMKELESLQREIIERLQYEVSHTSDLQKWWKEDFSYRMKVELANMATHLQNIVSRTVVSDMQWFNKVLATKFKTSVRLSNPSVIDKEDVSSFRHEKEFVVEDFAKQQRNFKVGAAVASMAGVLALSPIGSPLVMLATMGVGAGATFFGDPVLRRKLEQQQSDSKAELAKQVPQIIEDAISDSRRRLHVLYCDILASAKRKENLWRDARKQGIEESHKPEAREKATRLKPQIEKLKSLKAHI